MHSEQYNCTVELLLSAEPLKFDVSEKESLNLKISTERSKGFRILLPCLQIYFFFSFCCLNKLPTLRIRRKDVSKNGMNHQGKLRTIMPLKVSQPYSSYPIRASWTAFSLNKSKFASPQGYRTLIGIHQSSVNREVVRGGTTINIWLVLLKVKLSVEWNSSAFGLPHLTCCTAVFITYMVP